MSKTIFFAGAIITLAETDFACPKCECPHTEDDYYDRLYKSPQCLIYKACKGCKTKLGITYAMNGDTVVWLKEDEKKQ
jgi:hypothetical protein